MKKITSILLLIFLSMPQLGAYQEIYGPLTNFEKQVLTFGGDNNCKNLKEFKDSDIPTIFIPGILASWYSEEGYNQSSIKRWIPDPITHSYDTLFYTFKQNGYNLRDVFYKDEFNIYIDGNPKQSLYLFGYDWKKDNKFTAKLLSNLILQIREKYEVENGCDIGTVNIIAHSMGGLVARSMLEDMCIDEKFMNKENFYNRSGLKKGQIKEFPSTNCNNFTRINNLVTISTPQRGAPSSFPLWEKGSLGTTEGVIKRTLLEQQLSVGNNSSFYEAIHGYDDRIPNGIVTVGQLLPDINKSGNYNEELKYLNQNNNELDRKNHPVNSFLEELNTEENISKMFSNISGKYTMYYSTLTGNFGKNNIIGFNLYDKYFDEIKQKRDDRTSTYKGEDIYDFFTENINHKIYNIESRIRNEKGLGGDGTVPSKNLRLTPNTSNNGIEISKGDKFESIEMRCYSGEDSGKISLEGIDVDDKEKYKNTVFRDLYKGFGEESNMEICSHTKTPIGLSIEIFDKISGNNIFLLMDEDDRKSKERELLLQNIGYTNYLSHDYRGFLGDENSATIYDFTRLENFFIKDIKSDDVGYGYHPVLKDSEIKSELDKLDEGNFNDTFISLDFTGKIGSLQSLYRYEILSPINLIIEDEQGRKIGIDPDTGMIINEIPGAWTSGNTEGSNEPEFFLIPKVGTGQVLHKIHSYPTGEGEYHIVMNEIKNDDSLDEENKTSLVIAGVAQEGIIENYIVGIENNKAGFTKLDSSNYEIFNNAELDKKYKDILEKLYKILDKYDFKKKIRLRNRLIKFMEIKDNKFKDNEKVNYLIGKIVEYLK